MVVLSPQLIIALVVIIVVIVLVLLTFLICCLCHKCDQCARWSRRRSIARDEIVREREMSETRREFDEARQQHDAVRDEIRVKYNLNGGNSNAVVVP